MATNPSFSYKFDGSNPIDLICDGDAHFPSDTTHLRLTKTDTRLQSSFGRVVYYDSILVWTPGAQANFQTTVKFIIKPKFAASKENTITDRFVFFMAPADHTDGGNLGILDASGVRPAVVAVEFDVLLKPGWDPSRPRVGIEIELRVSERVVKIPADFIGKEMTLNVSHAAATSGISATVSCGTNLAAATYQCDLTGVLPEQVRVGLSASTSGCVAINDIIAWDFTSTLVKN